MGLLTKEEKARVLNAQSIGSHTGVVPIILVSDVGDHQNRGCAQNLDVDALGIGQPINHKSKVRSSQMAVRKPDQRQTLRRLPSSQLGTPGTSLLVLLCGMFGRQHG